MVCVDTSVRASSDLLLSWKVVPSVTYFHTSIFVLATCLVCGCNVVHHAVVFIFSNDDDLHIIGYDWVIGLTRQSTIGTVIHVCNSKASPKSKKRMVLGLTAYFEGPGLDNISTPSNSQ